jgi:hypothetical protein
LVANQDDDPAKPEEKDGSFRGVIHKLFFRPGDEHITHKVALGNEENDDRNNHDD